MEINPDREIIDELPFFSEVENFKWVQKPDKTGYFLNQALELIESCAIIFLMMALFYVIGLAVNEKAVDCSSFVMVFVFFLISGLSKWTAIFSTTYAITATQLLIYNSRKTVFLPLTCVQKVTVKFSYFDKRKGTGTLEIFCGEYIETDDGKVEKYNCFFNIQQPYQVLELIENLRRNQTAIIN